MRLEIAIRILNDKITLYEINKIADKIIRNVLKISLNSVVFLTVNA